MKIVFFYKNNQKISGALQQFFYLADTIANSTDHTVYYVNYYNETMEKYLRDSKVIFRDVETLDQNEFRGAYFITSLNYCFFLAEMMEDLADSKILLYDWHPYASNYLVGQLQNQTSEWNSIFRFFAEKKAVACMDLVTKFRLERHTETEFQNNVIPVAIVPKDEIYEISDVSIDRIRVGYLGRLDSDKIFSVINIADNLLKLSLDKPIDFHIIGDGNRRNLISLDRYAGKIRFIFTSYLVGEDMYHYVAENVDVLITMGMAALNGAEIGVPTLLVPLTNHHFYSDKYVFLYDALDYFLGGIPEEVERGAKVVYTLREALSMALEDKELYGRKCQQYMEKNHSLSFAAKRTIHYLQNSEMTMNDFLKQPIIAEQFSAFRKWEEKYDGSYSDFIVQVQKKRARSMQGRYSKIRNWIISNVVDKPLGTMQRKWAKHLNYKKYMEAQKHYEEVLVNKRKKAMDGNKLRVAFTVILDSTFPSLRIYKEMRKDDRFDPVIIVVPDVQRGIDYQIETYNHTLSNLQAEFGNDVIGGYDVVADQYLELGEDYDLVFFSNPYIKMAHVFHHVNYFLDKDVLTFYVNYGFFTLKFGREIVKQDFYNYVWKVFIDSNENLQDLKKVEAIHGKNGVVSGYIKMDSLADAVMEKKKRKRVLICPHHTVSGWSGTGLLALSNFQKYAELILELPEKYPELDFIFRPHPFLFYNLVSTKMWSEQERDQYLEKIERIPNMVYDTDGDYFATFANSDAMIHDCGSFTAEYLFTEKPCCYMLKEESQIKEDFLPMGQECLKHYYKAYEKEDIYHFIEDVVIRENDPLKEERSRFSREHLKFNYPNSAKFAYQYITDLLFRS